MTIKEANNELEKIDNQIEYYLNKKELELTKATKITSTHKEIIFSGGKRVDKFLNYACKSEEYDAIIDDLYNQKYVLEKYIDSELKRLKKYDKVLELIVYYKEQSSEKLTWWQISQRVHYSKTQCRRMYKEFISKRDV